jgi:hypothetical protein
MAVNRQRYARTFEKEYAKSGNPQSADEKARGASRYKRYAPSRREIRQGVKAARKKAGFWSSLFKRKKKLKAKKYKTTRTKSIKKQAQSRYGVNWEKDKPSAKRRSKKY